MAPERAAAKRYSFESDVWSLGCILYEVSFGIFFSSAYFTFRWLRLNLHSVVNEAILSLWAAKFTMLIIHHCQRSVFKKNNWKLQVIISVVMVIFHSNHTNLPLSMGFKCWQKNFVAFVILKF